MTAPGAKEAHALRRELGLLQLTGLGVNNVIGTGIFLLPGLVYASLGPGAVLSVVLGAALSVIFGWSYAHLGSRYQRTGGATLYATDAIGRWAGFQVGWLGWWSMMTSWAAISHSFAMTLSSFWPSAASTPHMQVVVLVLIVALTAVNLVGVKQGASVSTFFSAAKLFPIVAFILGGLFFLRKDNYSPFLPEGLKPVGEATLVMYYAFVGFEVITVPAGEMQDSKRHVPLALLLTIAGAAVIYLGVVAVTIGVLGPATQTANPVIDATEALAGRTAAQCMGAGILVSIFGACAAKTFVAPRYLFALAEEDFLSSSLTQVSAKTRLPSRSIVLSGAITSTLAVTGTFQTLVVFAVLGRVAQYLTTSIAAFRAPPQNARGAPSVAGRACALAGVVLAALLMTQATLQEMAAFAAVVVLGLPFYLVHRRTRSTGTGRAERA